MQSDSDSESAPEELALLQGGFNDVRRKQRRFKAREVAGQSLRAAIPCGEAATAAQHSDDTSEELSDASRDSGSDEEEDNEEDEVADVPFEQLAVLRAGGIAAGPQRLATGSLQQRQRKRKQTLQHRDNKNRPTEASSRQPIKRLRDVIQGPKLERKDPRFEDLSGNYNSDVFRKRYSFVFDETLPAERLSLKAKIRKTKRPDVKEALVAESSQMDATLREDQLRQKKRSFDAALKAKEKAAVKAGKKPFFLKPADKRKAELVAKYEELRSAGQLDKFLAKRRRKNAAKDHRYVPSVRLA